MPNAIGPTGLTTATQAELLAQYTADLQQIYGADINLASDSPDGQLINIFIQANLDLQDLLVQIYNSFDPDNAIGVVLDQRVAINGIQRQAGTFTITNVTLVLSQSVNLYGLDQTAQPVFTVADNAGNNWQLQTTQLGVGPGTVAYAFQAALPGANLTVPNTITVPVTVVLGVTSINNPTTYTTLGLNEESDANLKVRRQKSVSLASQGYLAGLLAALQNINGVISAFVYENNTGSTNGDGVPGHSIWVIIDGTASSSDIANAIYTKRNAGCGLFGQTSFTITQVDGSPFIVVWDFVVPENLFITFTASSIDGVNAPNIAAVRAGLVTSFTPGVNQEVDINHLATQVQDIDSNCLVTNAGFSEAKTQILNLSDVAASGSFKISYNGNLSASINWNDVIGTIQTKIRAVSGLSVANVTGSISSKILTIDLSLLTSALGIIYVTNNSLQTGGSVAITFSYDEDYEPTLTPTSKKNQFTIEAANIVIVPMILSPSTATVATSGTKQFTGLGGYGTLTYSISINNSGGSINTSTGLYTAGTTPSTDQLTVVDVLGNSATAAVAVN
jgi:hypothetical protein